jgi:O-antigen ligase
MGGRTRPASGADTLGWKSGRQWPWLLRATRPERAVLPRWPWQGVEWSLTYVAFLWYVAVITTYHLPGADVAMIAALVGLFTRGERVRVPGLLGWLGAFILWSAIGYVATAFDKPVFDNLILLGKIWLMVLVAANALRTRSQIRFFIVFLLACFVLYPLRGAFINYFLSHYTLLGRALWNFIYANPNDLAVLALLQLSMAAGLLTTERKKTPVWAGALVSVVLLTTLVLLTQSRGGVIALGVLTLLILIIRRVRLRLVIGMSVLAVIVVAVAPSALWTRMSGLTKATDTERLGEVDREGSAKGRYQIWRVAAMMINDHPIVGVGLGAYSYAHQRYAQDAGVDRDIRGLRDTHSTVLNVLAETGVPGLLLFLSLVGTTLFQAEGIRRRCRERLPLITMELLYLELGLVAFLVAGIFGSFAKLSFLYIHLILIWAIADVCRRELPFRRD